MHVACYWSGHYEPVTSQVLTCMPPWALAGGGPDNCRCNCPKLWNPVGYLNLLDCCIKLYQMYSTRGRTSTFLPSTTISDPFTGSSSLSPSGTVTKGLSGSSAGRAGADADGNPASPLPALTPSLAFADLGMYRLAAACTDNQCAYGSMASMSSSRSPTSSPGTLESPCSC